MENGVIADITPEDAVEVIHWKYEAPYDFYNIRAQAEAMQEFLMNPYYTIRCGEQLVGIFCIGTSAQVPEGRATGMYVERFIDIGLGMAPQLTGQGKGHAFFQKIASFLKERYPNTGVRLSVATFNKRAIKLYESIGFRRVASFPAQDADFIIMTHSTLLTVDETN
ncbi:GNAT family N-acetyltransferase [Alkalihalobacillus sp. FSL W8-0930]